MQRSLTFPICTEVIRQQQPGMGCSILSFRRNKERPIGYKLPKIQDSSSRDSKRRGGKLRDLIVIKICKIRNISN